VGATKSGNLLLSKLDAEWPQERALASMKRGHQALFFVVTILLGLLPYDLFAFNSDFVACHDAGGSCVTQDVYFAVFHLHGDIIDLGLLDLFLNLVSGNRAANDASQRCQVASRTIAYLIAREAARYSACDYAQA
jgi:hypothetical protein